MLHILALTASAQIDFDGSGSITGGPNFTIPANAGELLCDPSNSCNLIHTFNKFNINTGESVTFTGPGAGVNVANVLTRVTGLSSSNINGLLRTSGMPLANFFLINPNGVIFGPNAQLDIGGAFVVTTANEIQLADGGRLEVSENPNDALLSSASPSAFGFVTDSPAGIDVDRATLQVADGQTISLVGGDVTIVGGKLVAPSGHVNIVSVGSEGQVVMNASQSAPDIQLEGFDRHGSVQLTEFAQVNLDGSPAQQTSGGSLIIRAGSLSVEKSLMKSRTYGEENGGKIAFQVNQLKLVNGAQIQTATVGKGTGSHIIVTGIEGGKSQSIVLGDPASSIPSFLTTKADTQVAKSRAGNITLKTQRLDVVGPSYIETFSNDLGGSGDIVIDANLVNLDGLGNLQKTGIFAEAAGVPGLSLPLGIGKVDITADSLTMLGGAKIETATRWLPQGAQIAINAQRLSMKDPDTRIAVSDTTVSRFVEQTTTALIDINAPILELQNGAQISASPNRRQQGGTIMIDSSNRIVLSGPTTAIMAGPEPASVGHSGNILIGTNTNRSGDLLVTEGAAISVATRSVEPGGTIDIAVRSAVIENGGNITSRSETGANAGQISLDASDSVLLQSGGLIETEASQASGGNIFVLAGSDIALIDSSIITDAAVNGGDIALVAGESITLIDSLVSAAAGVEGGDILFDAPEVIEINNSRLIAAAGEKGGVVSLVSGIDINVSDSTISAESVVDGGDIELITSRRVELIRSTLTGRAGEDGGQITINPKFVILENSLIDGRAGGKPVQVVITNEAFEPAAASNLSTSNLGTSRLVPNKIPGNPVLLRDEVSRILTDAFVTTADLDLPADLLPPPTSLQNPQVQLQPHCASQFSGNISSFTVQGRGGNPVVPGRWLPSTDLAVPNSFQAAAPSSPSSSIVLR